MLGRYRGKREAPKPKREARSRRTVWTWRKPLARVGPGARRIGISSLWESSPGGSWGRRRSRSSRRGLWRPWP